MLVEVVALLLGYFLGELISILFSKTSALDELICGVIWMGVVNLCPAVSPLSSFLLSFFTILTVKGIREFYIFGYRHVLSVIESRNLLRVEIYTLCELVKMGEDLYKCGGKYGIRERTIRKFIDAIHQKYSVRIY